MPKDRIIITNKRGRKSLFKPKKKKPKKIFIKQQQITVLNPFYIKKRRN